MGKGVHFVHLIQRATFAWAYFAAAEQANAIAFLFLAFRQALSLYLLGSAVGLMSHERKGRQHEIMYVIIKETDGNIRCKWRAMGMVVLAHY